MTVNELVVQFGENKSLCGIVTQPAQVDVKLPAILILNSGLMHRVGACRVSVALARKLARQGFLVLRFDLSGLGDSSNRPSKLEADDRIVEEVKLAMDLLEDQYGVKTFVSYGLCSGAQNSFKAALQDRRIKGLIGIDNFGFHTKKYYLHHYFPRLLSIKGILSMLQKIPEKAAKIFKIGKNDYFDNSSIWVYPPQKEVEKGFQHLTKQGMKYLYIYTGSWSHEYNYKHQIFDMYPSVDFGNQLEIYYEPSMSHMLVEQESQQFVFEHIGKWLGKHFSSVSGT